VIEREPAVFNVTPDAKVFTPASPAKNVYALGRTAWTSVELNVTVPVNPVAVFPFASRATTVTVNGDPAVAFEL
jgi:hypothetical protein